MEKKESIVKNFILAILFILIVSSCDNETKLNISYPEYNFLIANDLGRNGYYDQKVIAESMGQFAENVDIEFIVASGDIHHFEGVASINDPLWLTNYELVYSHPELMLHWYPVLGNHEYRGNTQACLDYANVSRRWVMPDRYYTMVRNIDDSTSLRLLFVDTSPMIDKYREDSITYPDAKKQSLDKQLAYIDSVLTVSKETWTIVVGHHPIYAETSKSIEERTDLQKRLAPLLEKYNVDFYFSGHIHNFQHLKPEGSTVDYIVNSSASKSRKVKAIDGTVYCSDKTGFAVCSVTQDILSFTFLDKDGKPIYHYARSK